MPTIEITADQAKALAMGQNVTLTAPKPPLPPEKRYVIITSGSKNVYVLRTRQPVPVGTDVVLPTLNPPATRIATCSGDLSHLRKHNLASMRATVVEA